MSIDQTNFEDGMTSPAEEFNIESFSLKDQITSSYKALIGINDSSDFEIYKILNTYSDSDSLPKRNNILNNLCLFQKWVNFSLHSAISRSKDSRNPEFYELNNEYFFLDLKLTVLIELKKTGTCTANYDEKELLEVIELYQEECKCLGRGYLDEHITLEILETLEDQLELIKHMAVIFQATDIENKSDHMLNIASLEKTIALQLPYNPFRVYDPKNPFGIINDEYSYNYEPYEASDTTFL